MSDLSVSVTKLIQAPIETVFDAWLNPTMLAQFILPMPGMPAPDVENDPQVGGQFKIVMHVGEEKVPHTGEYLEINRPHKLVFTWESPCSISGSTVTLTFSEAGDQQTQVELKHIKFADEESRADHESGWSNILISLQDLF